MYIKTQLFNQWFNRFLGNLTNNNWLNTYQDENLNSQVLQKPLKIILGSKHVGLVCKI